MKEDNRIKEFRQSKKLSQRALAKLSNISQQHLQRLEAGSAPIRIDLALTISEALGSQIGKVFPTLAPILQKFPGQKLRSEAALQKLEEAGVEVESGIWTVELGLRAGEEKQFTIPAADKNRLAGVLLHPGGQKFFVFDSERYGVAIALDHTTYVRLMWDRAGQLHKVEADYEPGIAVWMNGRADTLQFDAEPDEEEDPGEPGQLRSLLWHLEHDPEDFVSFLDEDGEAVYLRRDDIAIIAISHSLLEPIEYDDDEDAAKTPNLNA